MRFKTDENLPEEIAEILRAAGWDAFSVIEQQLGGKVDPHRRDLSRRISRSPHSIDHELCLVNGRRIWIGFRVIARYGNNDTICPP